MLFIFISVLFDCCRSFFTVPFFLSPLLLYFYVIYLAVILSTENQAILLTTNCLTSL